jgi:hypothetical protein
MKRGVESYRQPVSFPLASFMHSHRGEKVSSCDFEVGGNALLLANELICVCDRTPKELHLRNSEILLHTRQAERVS